MSVSIRQQLILVLRGISKIFGKFGISFPPDIVYLNIIFKHYTGYKMNIKNPKTFNEKIQWLKLYDRKPDYTKMADKWEVRKYVSEKIGVEYLVPILGIWEDYDDIDFMSLPEQFVMKCTHDSASAIICRDKKEFDFVMARKKLSKALKGNFYYSGREYCYKNIKPRIVVEKYIEDSSGRLNDFKIMCFNGKVKCCFACTKRRSREGLRVTFFDTEWNRLPFVRKYPNDSDEIERPVNFQKMIEIAERISEHIPFLRVDFYEVKGRLYLGELTFYPGSGIEWFEPFEWDMVLGSWLILPEITRKARNK